MTEIDHATGLARPPQGLLTLTHVIYGLHAFSAVTGLVGAAFIVTAFLTGWPSLIAVVLNYVKRGETRGSFLESHFRWQISTFWRFGAYSTKAARAFWGTDTLPVRKMRSFDLMQRTASCAVVTRDW